MVTLPATRKPKPGTWMPRLLLAGLLGCAPAAGAETNGWVLPQVNVDYFYEPGCDECLPIERDILPELAQRYAGCCVLKHYDVGIATNYFKLLAIQEETDAYENAHVYMVVEGQYVLSGLAAIRTNLFATIDLCLSARLTDTGAAQSAASAQPAPPEAGPAMLRQRLQRFTAAGVITAGLIDSINPCAVATLVFFMSLISVSRVGRRRMLLAGGAFVAACFATYLLLGFGVFRILHLFFCFALLKRLLEVLMVTLLAAFAGASFRDAIRFRRTGNPRDVLLQFPDGIKQRIHEIMRRGLSRRNLVLGGLGIGVAVTALESVCTGQVYVPTLVFVVKSGQSVLRALFYLVLYNLMFILPLAAILILTWWGLRTPTLVEWSRKNVVASKLLLGLFFAGMAVLIAAW